MAEAVYILCALTSSACALLLLNGYRANRTRLLFWSSLSFMGLAAHNILLFLDLVTLPNIDLFYWRTGVALLAMLVLIYGLVWESR